MQDNSVVLTQEQAERLVNVLLTHMEDCQGFVKRYYIESVNEALQEHCAECKVILDAIICQLDDTVPEKENR